MNRIRPIARLVSALFLLAVSVTAVPAGTVRALGPDRYVATTGSDESNNCSAPATPCLTVGHAIFESSGNDIIHIAAGTYVETLLTPAVNLALVGAGADSTYLDGGGAGIVVYNGASTSLSLSDLTVRNGKNDPFMGAGIVNYGTLSLYRVKVTGNKASSGAGVDTHGPTTIIDSLISGNTATTSGGGAIFGDTADTVSLSSTTLSYNSAPSSDAAIHFQGGGTLNLTNVTITGNTGTGSGALLAVAGSTTQVVNSTISGNTGGPTYPAVVSYGTISFKNTIISANSPGNCYTTGATSWTSLGHNLDSADTCDFAAAGDLVNTDPELAILGSYGGPVPTQTLLGGSPAIDAGTNVGCASPDARGIGRPIDGDNDATPTCDMGAVEMKQQTTLTAITGVAPDPSRVGHSVTVDVTVTGTLTTPTGSVTIRGSTACTATLVGGSGSCSVFFTDPGVTGVLASYTGDSTHDASQQALIHFVLPVLADFDGGGTTDMAVYRPSTRGWYIRNVTSTIFGLDGDIPIPADFDGNGTTDIAVFRPSTRGWFVRGQTATVYGLAGDVPIPADYNGGGTADIAIYRPSTSGWYAKDIGATIFGLPGDIPVPGDYNADGITEIAVYRPSTRGWFIKDGDSAIYGLAGDIPVPGDYDGNGTTDIAVYRPSTSGWFIRGQFSTVYGLIGDIPVPGDYDGNGTTDIAVYRPSTSGWYVKDISATLYGLVGDYPLPAPDTNADGDPYQ